MKAIYLAAEKAMIASTSTVCMPGLRAIYSTQPAPTRGRTAGSGGITIDIGAVTSGLDHRTEQRLACSRRGFVPQYCGSNPNAPVTVRSQIQCGPHRTTGGGMADRARGYQGLGSN